MKDFAGRLAVVTGGGAGMGRELARQLVAEGCNVATCDISPKSIAETEKLCGRMGKARASPPMSPTSPMKPRSCAPRRGGTRARHRQGAPALQQRRHRRRRQPVLQQPGAVGTDLQHLLGRRLSARGLPADAGERGRGPHRQREQRERVLGIARAGRAAYGLLRGEIRREGLYRGPDRRSRRACAARQMLGRHAGHIGTSIAAFPQVHYGTDSDHGPRGDRAIAGAPGASGRDMSQVPTPTCRRSRWSGHGNSGDASTTAAAAATVFSTE